MVPNYADINVKPHWLKIWSVPRAVTRNAINKYNAPHNAQNHEYVGVLTYLFFGFLISRLINSFTLILPISVGIFYLHGIIVCWVGSWFGGKATRIEARLALTWSTVALSQMLLMLTVMVTTATMPKSADFLQKMVLIVPLCMLLGIIIQSRCIAEAHQFNDFKGFLAWLISSLIILAPQAALIYCVIPW